MEYLNDPRIKYMLFRCFKCGELLTAFGLKKVWDKAPTNPKPGENIPLCACGSGHISPSNAKWWEEVFLPRCWKVIIQLVFWPWLKKKFGK